MATLDELVIELRANHAQLTTSLSAVTRQLEGLDQHAASTSRRVNSSFDSMGKSAQQFGAMVRGYVGVQTVRAILDAERDNAALRAENDQLNRMLEEPCALG